MAMINMNVYIVMRIVYLATEIIELLLRIVETVAAGTIHGEADLIRYAAEISAEIAIDMKL